MRNASGPIAVGPPPPPPPPPAAGVSTWRNQKPNTQALEEDRSKSLSKPLTITIDGEEVPQALAQAFNNPRKDKKPFTYFPGGRAPDLSDKPSPNSVRKANPNLIPIPGAPKVLPIVTDQELEYEQQRQSAKSNYSNPSNPNDMTSSTLLHAQYNSPMSLYSKENVQEELNRATGRPSSALSGSGKFSVEQSGAYRMLHGGNQVPPQHSARLDEPKSEDYPRYRGFVDPNVQSPSFKRLQYVTDSGAEEEHTGASYQNGPAQPQVAQSHQAPAPQQWSADGPPVAQYDPAAADDRNQPLDPSFAAKIAAAERPNVPASVSPSWVRKSEEKRERWQGYSSGGQQQESYQPPPQQAYQPPPPQAYQPPPPQAYQPQEYQPPRHYQPSQPQPGWSQPPSEQGYQDKWQRHYSQYHFESGNTGQDRRDQVMSRPRSTEPDRFRRQDKEWMKPYVAPNVQGFSPRSGSASGRPYSDYGPPSSWSNEPHFGGSPGGGSYSKKTTTSTYRSHRTEGGSAPEYGTSYAPRKEVTVSSLVSGEAERPGPQPASVPNWSYKAEEKRNLWENYGSSIDPQAQRRPPLPERPPSWTQRAEDTTRTWRNEAEAWRQRSQMEQDVARRAASAGPAEQPGSGGGAYWRQKQVPHEGAVTTYTTTSGPPVNQKWQEAPGSSTKSQSQGSYVDPQGNQVNYVKEVYTSSEPGKEFSMLTQEEKKALEEPLQPGVVSRHVTSKYYKKSTYTSQTTTSTNQTPPAVSFPSMSQNRYIEAPRPGNYGPGDTQF